MKAHPRALLEVRRRSDVWLNKGSDTSLSDTKDQMEVGDTEPFLDLYLLEFPVFKEETQACLVVSAL